MIARAITAIHDWLAGSAMTTQDRDRISRDIYQPNHNHFGGPFGGA